MATLKVKFRPSTVSGKEGTLFYQLICNRRVRGIATGYKIFSREWDTQTNDIVIPSLTDSTRTHRLVALKNRIALDIGLLRRVIDLLDRQARSYTHDDILALYLSSQGTDTLFVFMEELIVLLKRQGRLRTSETYATARRSFFRFLDRQDIRLEEIDSDLMSAYEAHLRMAGISKNTSSFYMRILRAVYNRAVEKRLTPQNQPFRYVYTGVDKTVKRALSLPMIRQIKNMDLTSEPRLEYARDLFLFSFYTRGMSFVDMTYLKKSDLKNGMLTYRRKKTGQLLFIRWEQCMQEIADRYPNVHPVYLLPIITRKDDDRRQYKNKGHQINGNLRKIGEELRLSVTLTLYVARHTWANIARSRNIPLSVISESMGHDSEATTRIYLASLDSAIVDRANRLVIKSLSESISR